MSLKERVNGMGKQTKLREIYVVYQKKKGEWEWSILKILLKRSELKACIKLSLQTTIIGMQ
jgi:ABC-type transport system involved in cytochrome c biogenesis ATPase subunit